MRVVILPLRLMRLRIARLAPALAVALAAGAAGAQGGERIDGPVVADIVEIIDGDSLRVNARVWPGHRVTVNVRLRGVDAPEMRASCAREKDLAVAARDALGRKLGPGPVVLTNISGGKYYGRVLADVGLADGSDVADYLMRHAPVRPYRGGRRGGWCG